MKAIGLTVASSRNTVLSDLEVCKKLFGFPGGEFFEGAAMSDKPVKAGIVGLGRWAKVLTKASKKSTLLEIVAGYSRSEQKRTAFQQEFGVRAATSMEAILADPEIQGVILTVPNEQHLPMALEVAKSRKHVYTEKPIASTLEDGLEIAALQQKYGITVT
ncbi:MAG: Gfo/Idh/MocA family oxidoreductase, partial [Verrucomicrobiota bacterium]|nr:Gfo/Idh/MocA family oxidoreductase [Verrucomicrobiota bacterium]